ncbi:hypothetical protein BDZ89DRAFT_1042910 [Hymenopellis radicata]|nr:hypothetical protein BDZ89DRAFT_1042910 [Hymenopellis radicata]
MPPGNHLFVVHVVPDLLFHHTSSISRPDSIDIFTELCEILLIFVQDGRDNADTIVKRLAVSPTLTMFCFNRVVQDALQRLRATQDRGILLGALRDMATAYALMAHCFRNGRFHSAIYDPMTQRRTTEVAWRVVRCDITSEDALSEDIWDMACPLFMLLVSAVDWAIQFVGKEAVLLVLRHGFIPSVLQFRRLAQDAHIPPTEYEPLLPRLDKVLDSVALYMCYSSVLREAERMRKSVLELELDWTRPIWRELCQTITARYTGMGAVPSICDAVGCPEREKTVTPARCAGCSISQYCSRSCQRTHWIAGHRTLCSSFQQYRIDSRGGVQTETGFLTPKETAYLSATVHDLVRRGNYLIHQPAWILTVDASKLVLDVKYGPRDDAWKDSVGQRFSTDQNVMNSRGIIVFLLLPHGGLHPHFECCALLTPEWIRNPTATYLPELPRPLEQPTQ